MKQRPKSVIFLSAVFFSIPFFMLLMTLVKAQFNVTDLAGYWNLRSICVAACAWVLSAGIWSVRPWGYLLFLAVSALGIAYSLFTYLKEPDLSGYFYLIALTTLTGSVVFLLQKHVASPYFNPRERWWETPPRYKSNLRVDTKIDGHAHIATLVDISRTGCFLKFTGQSLIPGDIISLKLTYLDIRLELLSKVIRTTRDPEGAGLMFLDLSRADRRDLKMLLQNIEQHVVREAPMEPHSADVA